GTSSSTDSPDVNGELVEGAPSTVNSFTDNGVNLLTFDASGTGEVEGELIPEPTTTALAMIAASLGLGLRRRS
ncbi:MAG: PEP-CTERM sorting domain-containing protein, partial [Planctomycetota bacterium]